MSDEPPKSPRTLTLEAVLPATPEQVFLMLTEPAATAAMGPLTVKVASKAASAVGASLSTGSRQVAGQVVDDGFGTFWAAVLGALSERWETPPPGTGVALGILLWLSVDEAALPALGLSGKASEYPRETHLRGLAAHVVFGVVLDRALALLRAAVRR